MYMHVSGQLTVMFEMRSHATRNRRREAAQLMVLSVQVL